MSRSLGDAKKSVSGSGDHDKGLHLVSHNPSSESTPLEMNQVRNVNVISNDNISSNIACSSRKRLIQPYEDQLYPNPIEVAHSSKRIMLSKLDEAGKNVPIMNIIDMGFDKFKKIYPCRPKEEQQLRVIYETRAMKMLEDLFEEAKKNPAGPHCPFTLQEVESALEHWRRDQLEKNPTSDENEKFTRQEGQHDKFLNDPVFQTSGQHNPQLPEFNNVINEDATKKEGVCDIGSNEIEYECSSSSSQSVQSTTQWVNTPEFQALLNKRVGEELEKIYDRRKELEKRITYLENERNEYHELLKRMSKDGLKNMKYWNKKLNILMKVVKKFHKSKASSHSPLVLENGASNHQSTSGSAK